MKTLQTYLDYNLIRILVILKVMGQTFVCVCGEYFN